MVNLLGQWTRRAGDQSSRTSSPWPTRSSRDRVFDDRYSTTGGLERSGSRLRAMLTAPAFESSVELTRLEKLGW